MTNDAIEASVLPLAADRLPRLFPPSAGWKYTKVEVRGDL